jgi:serine/threonine protein kinase/tetratricopeptide (TPR) repeat protein
VTEVARLNAAVGDRYLVERELGEGGMATVYLAQDLRHSRPVALKVLKDELTASLGVERFLDEIRTTANLQHAHILPLFDSGSADGLLFYVMPYVVGETLAARLRREKQLSFDDALDFARHVALAIGYAHSRSIVHLDIKPENVMISGGVALVADFGIARALDRATDMENSGSGMTVGTPLYMSPEQSFGEGTLDGRSDIYSLGTVLFECLTGTPPFTGPSPQAILGKRITSPAPAVSSIRRTAPAAIDALVARSLAMEASDRFATGEAMADAILAARVAAAAPQDPGRLAPRVETPRGADVPRSVKRLAVLPLTNLAGDEAQDYFVAGMHEALIGELSLLGDVDVISRQSTLRYRNSELPLGEIAQQLGVEAIVTGSVIRAEDTVRVQVTLTEALPRERVLWSQTFDQAMRNVLFLHAQVTSAIAERISVTLSPRQAARLTHVRGVDPVAYDVYLKGRHSWNRRDPEGLKLALQYFGEAQKRDPTFPGCYAGMADVFLAFAINGFGSDENLARAKGSASQALALDPDMAEAHATLGWTKTGLWDWSGARESLRTAIDLNPRYANAHQWLGQMLLYSNEIETGLRSLRRAVELDPFSLPTAGALGIGLNYARRYEESAKVLGAAIDAVPSFGPLYGYLATAYAYNGLPDKAAATIERAGRTVGRGMFVLMGDIVRLNEIGDRAGSEAVLQELVTTSAGGEAPLSKSAIGMMYSVLGDVDSAMGWLEKSFAVKESSLMHLRVAREFEAVRADPRGKDILRRMGFDGA